MTKLSDMVHVVDPLPGYFMSRTWVEVVFVAAMAPDVEALREEFSRFLDAQNVVHHKCLKLPGSVLVDAEKQEVALYWLASKKLTAPRELP